MTYDRLWIFKSVPTLIIMVIITVLFTPSCWTFWLTYTYFTILLVYTTIKHLSKFNKKEIPFLLNHIGLLIVLLFGAQSSFKTQSLKMNINKAYPEFQGVDKNNYVKELPFTVQLKDFKIETYPQQKGSNIKKPKQYTSLINIKGHEGCKTAIIEVNKPYTYDGWTIYQYSYDMSHGKQNTESILLFVHDPLLPAVYIGFIMMLTGALFMLIIPLKNIKKTSKNYTVFFIISALLTILFSWFSFYTLNIKTLMPALRSPWFAPHIEVYMCAYALLSTATIMAFILISRKTPSLKILKACDMLVYAGIAFFTIGMLFGAFWANEAWGHYWTWDPKETWAAATWFAYLAYIHYRRERKDSIKPALIILICSFLILQMCWWGVNYLPSTKNMSMHTYNMQK